MLSDASRAPEGDAEPQTIRLQVWAEGCKAFEQGRDLDACPYGSLQRDWWVDGWRFSEAKAQEGA